MAINFSFFNLVSFNIKLQLHLDRLNAGLFGKFLAVKAKHSFLKDKIRGRLIRNTESYNEPLQIKKSSINSKLILWLPKKILGVIARTVDPQTPKTSTLKTYLLFLKSYSL
jgi:hypothetical protein